MLTVSLKGKLISLSEDCEVVFWYVWIFLNPDSKDETFSTNLFCLILRRTEFKALQISNFLYLGTDETKNMFLMTVYDVKIYLI